jgi:hypothetical protein
MEPIAPPPLDTKTETSLAENTIRVANASG